MPSHRKPVLLVNRRSLWPTELKQSSPPLRHPLYSHLPAVFSEAVAVLESEAQLEEWSKPCYETVEIVSDFLQSFRIMLAAGDIIVVMASKMATRGQTAYSKAAIFVEQTISFNND
ncbi:hypothetical protein Ancab_012651 [Ancistrocladus abbreviatus]